MIFELVNRPERLEGIPELEYELRNFDEILKSSDLEYFENK